jgi:hypothetical protein
MADPITGMCDAEHPDNPEIRCIRFGDCLIDSHLGYVQPKRGRNGHKGFHIQFGYDWEESQRRLAKEKKDEMP